ncbi:hypothetical protein AVEN_121667-1 [Araneus ventricosus]|uniref:Uncharacterized protein n=1 Tax=Araneus ventricosus TaxID=182803 RepID=A0A4Y2Q3W8_ARAVE|nr:hypothetical protein AVEN_121667-1 [Araneus ventricosus]
MNSILRSVRSSGNSLMPMLLQSTTGKGIVNLYLASTDSMQASKIGRLKSFKATQLKFVFEGPSYVEGFPNTSWHGSGTVFTAFGWCHVCNFAVGAAYSFCLL